MILLLQQADKISVPPQDTNPARLVPHKCATEVNKRSDFSEEMIS